MPRRRRRAIPAAMAPPRPWADLHQDVLIHIGDRVDLKSYASARGACRSWRGALVPPGPALLAVTEDATMSMRRPSAASLPLRRSFDLAAIASGSRCVGSRNGWLALCIHVGGCLDSGGHDRLTAFFLVNPVAGVEIPLPPLFYGSKWISKVVFAPCPAAEDFTAVGICDADRIVYVTAGARRWAVLPPPVPFGEQIVDLVYHDGERKVYCLSAGGDVHVLHLPERRRQRPDAVQDHPKISVLRPSQRIGFLQPYPDVTDPVTIEPPNNWGSDDIVDEDHTGQTISYSYTVSGTGFSHPIPRRAVSAKIKSYWIKKLTAEAKEPDLNAPVRREQLLPADMGSFSPATAFAPPYDVVSEITSAKHLVLCEGNLYQVWRNTSCTVALRPPDQHNRVPLDEVFVLRYYPQRRPYWDVVKDLGGYSFFVGTNNAVSMYAEGVPGLRGNCVYWIDGHAREKGMVFDMETGRSTPCGSTVGLAVDGPEYQRRRCFWYFLNDTVTTGQQR